MQGHSITKSRILIYPKPIVFLWPGQAGVHAGLPKQLRNCFPGLLLIGAKSYASFGLANQDTG